MKKWIYVLCAWSLLSGCTNHDLLGMIWGSSPKADARLEASMQYNDSVGEIHWVVPENYLVYVVADTHVDSTTRRLDAFVNAYKSDPDCRLVIHVGDLINGRHNYPRFFEVMARNPEGYVQGKDTVFYAVGNHDLYFSQWVDYLSYVHTSTYWFDTRTKGGQLLDLFICLDTGGATLGKSGINWLRNTLAAKAQENYRHIIVFSHTNLFYTDGSQRFSSNFPMEETYDICSIFRTYGVDMYWNGHEHNFERNTYGDMEYYSFPTLQDPISWANRYAVVDMRTLTISLCNL